MTRRFSFDANCGFQYRVYELIIQLNNRGTQRWQREKYLSAEKPEPVLLRSGAGTNVNNNTFRIDEATGRKLLQELAQPSDN